MLVVFCDGKTFADKSVHFSQNLEADSIRGPLILVKVTGSTAADAVVLSYVIG
jgi:hypothetical protein